MDVMSTISLTEDQQNPLSSSNFEFVVMIREPVQGYHQGQRSSVPRQQAEHMTAPDCIKPSVTFSLASEGPSTHDEDGAVMIDCSPTVMRGLDLRIHMVMQEHL